LYNEFLDFLPTTLRFPLYNLSFTLPDTVGEDWGE